jgi:hypothetical protein
VASAAPKSFLIKWALQFAETLDLVLLFGWRSGSPFLAFCFWVAQRFTILSFLLFGWRNGLPFLAFCFWVAQRFTILSFLLLGGAAVYHS